jgi:hypothetical protein
MDIDLDEYENEEVVKLFEYKKPMQLFESSNMVKICAPMVRYTKYKITIYKCNLKVKINYEINYLDYNLEH